MVISMISNSDYIHVLIGAPLGGNLRFGIHRRSRGSIQNLRARKGERLRRVVEDTYFQSSLGLETNSLIESVVFTEVSLRIANVGPNTEASQGMTSSRAKSMGTCLFRRAATWS